MGGRCCPEPSAHGRAASRCWRSSCSRARFSPTPRLRSPPQRAPTTHRRSAPTTTLRNAPTTTLRNAPTTTLRNAPTTTLRNAPTTTLRNAPTTRVHVRAATTASTEHVAPPPRGELDWRGHAPARPSRGGGGLTRQHLRRSCPQRPRSQRWRPLHLQPRLRSTGAVSSGRNLLAANHRGT
jgi:hypothetical protein